MVWRFEDSGDLEEDEPPPDLTSPSAASRPSRQDEDSDAYSDDFAYDDWETEDQETETSQEENAPRHEDDGDRAGESERPADPHDAEDADEDDAYSDDFDANDQETEDPGPEIDHEETRHEDSAVTDEESRMNEESPRGPSVGPAQDAEVRADEEDLDETYSDLFEADPDTEDPGAETDHDPEAETDHDPEAETDHDPGAETDHDPEAETDHDQAETDHDPEAETDHDPGAGTDHDSRHDDTVPADDGRSNEELRVDDAVPAQDAAHEDPKDDDQGPKSDHVEAQATSEDRPSSADPGREEAVKEDEDSRTATEQTPKDPQAESHHPEEERLQVEVVPQADEVAAEDPARESDGTVKGAETPQVPTETQETEAVPGVPEPGADQPDPASVKAATTVTAEELLSQLLTTVDESADADPEEEVEEEVPCPVVAEEEEDESNLSPDQKRARFEGRQEKIQLTRKVKKMMPVEAGKFLLSLRELGGGSAGVAWRRLFENDEVKFDDFCGALVSLHFSGDVIRLWHELAGPSTPQLKFEAVDKESALLLNAFKVWCSIGERDGPLEVFRTIDQAFEGSDSLTAEKFVDGLQRLGFFDPPGVLAKEAIWKKLETREAVLQNLWPMLDQHTRGCITTDSLLFLEKDPQKRASVLRERTRRRMKRRPPEAHKSEKIIHKLVMETTAMGNKHWSQVPEGHVAVGRPRSGPVLPKVRPIRRVSSAPDLGLDVKTLFDDKVELPGTPPVTPPGSEPPKELRVRKEERRPVPSCRKAYCGGLVPLPSLRKGSQVAQPKMLPEELVLKGAKPKKAKKVPIGPTFDPSQLSHFLSSTQESIWRHYFGDAKGHEPPMLEDADRDVTDAVAE